MNQINTPRPSEGQTELIDTHCHLDMAAYGPDLDSVISDAKKCGVKRIITIGINEESSRQAISLSKRYPGIYATIGFHPHDASQASADILDRLMPLTGEERVVGWGEIGLDYVKQYAPREDQLKAFTRQLHLAKEAGLPVVIHDREAHEDTLRILRETGPFPKHGVMHCFSGNSDLAQKIIDMGFMISIPGVVTFKNAKSLQEVVKTTDLRYLLLETDGPFLSPVPFRGKRNTPAMLPHIARMVADLQQKSLEEVALATTANAIKLFNLPEQYDT